MRSSRGLRFDVDRFIADCCAARAQDSSYKAVHEVVARAVSEPASVLASLGGPGRAGLQTLYRSEVLTILNVVWGPRMILMPHNHRLWAVIGIYSGREDNVFWRRVRTDPHRIEAAGAKAFCANDAEPLGRDIIHSVTNPIPRYTGAIHVYGGDFFGVTRSDWDPETLREQPYDIGKVRRLFEESNALCSAS